ITLLASTSQGCAPDRVSSFRPEEDRQPTVSELGGQFHAAVAERCQVDRDPVTDGVGQDLQWFAQAGPLLRWQRQRIRLAVVLDDLAAPDHATDLDDLARALKRPVVGNT